MKKNRDYTKTALGVIAGISLASSIYLVGENADLYSKLDERKDKIEELSSEVNTYSASLEARKTENEKLQKDLKKTQEDFEKAYKAAKESLDLAKELDSARNKYQSEAAEWKQKYQEAISSSKKM